jgi:hypothetical protein
MVEQTQFKPDKTAAVQERVAAALESLPGSFPS